MEHAQRENSATMVRDLVLRLNPYFNGTCSKRSQRINNDFWRRRSRVLILILMEHAQREHFFIRPYVLICYIETITLINAFASEKCTCFLLKTLQR